MSRIEDLPEPLFDLNNYDNSNIDNKESDQGKISISPTEEKEIADLFDDKIAEGNPRPITLTTSEILSDLNKKEKEKNPRSKRYEKDSLESLTYKLRLIPWLKCQGQNDSNLKNESFLLDIKEFVRYKSGIKIEESEKHIKKPFWWEDKD